MSPTSFNLSQIESPMYTASSTGNDTYTATLSPAPTSLVTGQKVRLRFTTANTGACSLNLNGLGAINIKTRGGNDPVDGDISANSIRELTYDGTNFVLDYNKATTAEPGCVEMATDAEAIAGTDETRYVNSKQVKDNYKTTIIASDVPIASSGALLGTTSTTPVKLKEIQIKANGTYRVYFDMATLETGYTVGVQIYKNGVALGTLRTSGSYQYPSTIGFSEDFSFVNGDLVQAYVYGSGGRQGYIQNFQIRASIFSVFPIVNL